MSALAEWNPYARCEINLTLLFRAFRRPLLIPISTAASTPALCLRIVRASFTNGFSLAAGRPREPRVKALGRFVLGDLVDEAQLAVDQERTEHPFVGLLHLGEPEQLRGRLVGGILEQAVAHALDPLAGVGAGAAVLVVLGATDLVGRLGAELADVEGVEHDPGARDTVRSADRFLIAGGHVDRDRPDRPLLFVGEPVEERLQAGGVAAFGGPPIPPLSWLATQVRNL